MPKKQVRNNEYYLQRLENEHPSVFADYKAGKFKSANAAFEFAGLKTARTPYHELSNAWHKASPAQRMAFLQDIGAVIPPVASSTNSPHVAVAKSAASMATLPGGNSVVGSDRRLTKWGISRIEAIMNTRKLKLGMVMREMGFDPLDASIGYAIRQASKLKNPALVTALEAWVAKHAHI